MAKRWQLMAFTGFRSAKNGERGLTLIEVIVALGILSAVAVVFLLGMTTSSKSVMVSQERVAAESLAKSEMEYVKSVTYQNAPWSYELPGNPPSWDLGHSLPDGYGGYSVHVQADLLAGHDPDDGIQKITIVVSREGDPLLTQVGYNTN